MKSELGNRPTSMNTPSTLSVALLAGLDVADTQPLDHLVALDLQRLVAAAAA